VVASLIAIFGLVSLYFQIQVSNVLDVHSIALSPVTVDLTNFIGGENQRDPQQHQHPASSEIKIAYAVSLIHCHRLDLSMLLPC
jgi:hypothetical protein